MEYQRQKIDMTKLLQQQQTLEDQVRAEINDCKEIIRRASTPDLRRRRNALHSSIDSDGKPRKKKRVLSVRRFRINKDGSRTLVSTTTLSSKASLNSIDSIDQEMQHKKLMQKINNPDKKLEMQTERVDKKKKPKKKKSLKRMIILQRSQVNFTPRKGESRPNLKVSQVSQNESVNEEIKGNYSTAQPEVKKQRLKISRKMLRNLQMKGSRDTISGGKLIRKT